MDSSERQFPKAIGSWRDALTRAARFAPLLGLFVLFCCGSRFSVVVREQRSGHALHGEAVAGAINVYAVPIRPRKSTPRHNRSRIAFDSTRALAPVGRT